MVHIIISLLLFYFFISPYLLVFHGPGWYDQIRHELLQLLQRVRYDGPLPPPGAGGVDGGGRRVADGEGGHGRGGGGGGLKKPTQINSLMFCIFYIQESPHPEEEPPGPGSLDLGRRIHGSLYGGGLRKFVLRLGVFIEK